MNKEKKNTLKISEFVKELVEWHTDDPIIAKRIRDNLDEELLACDDIILMDNVTLFRKVK